MAEKSTEDVTKWSKPLYIKLLWGDKILDTTGIRRGVSYKVFQEKVFETIKAQKLEAVDGEEFPTCKEDLCFVVGGTRLENGAECVTKHITEIVGADVSDSVRVRLHNAKSDFLSRTRSFKKSGKSLADYKSKMIEQHLNKTEACYEDEKAQEKYKVEVTKKVDIAFFEVEKDELEGSVGPIICLSKLDPENISNSDPENKATVKFLRLNIPNDQVLQLCSRRSTGGWVVESNIEVQLIGSTATFQILCDGAYMLRRYKQKIGLKIDVSRLNEKYDMQYPLTNLGPFWRGNKHYYLPGGYTRVALRLPNFEEYENWCVAFHGTNSKVVGSIIRDGLIKPLNTPSLYTDNMLKPPSNHINLNATYDGIKGFADAIFVSPNIDYASSPVYAHPYEYGGKRYKIVFQVRVKPGSFTEHKSTTKNEFNGELVEWRIANPEDVVVYGLLYKEI